MAGASLIDGRRQQLPPNDITRQWVRGIGLAAVVGLAYFVAADFSVRLLVEPEGVAVFWPAAGIYSGILIAFGLPAGWPVLGGVVAATIATHLIIGDPLWGAGGDNRIYHFAATRALGDGVSYHLAISNFLVAWRSL